MITDPSIHYFNSQPRKGADYEGAKEYDGIVAHFNSQPRKGADAESLYIPAGTYNFNSQPRKGADIKSQAAVTLKIIFQLTAPQGG